MGLLEFASHKECSKAGEVFVPRNMGQVHTQPPQAFGPYFCGVYKRGLRLLQKGTHLGTHCWQKFVPRYIGQVPFSQPTPSGKKRVSEYLGPPSQFHRTHAESGP